MQAYLTLGLGLATLRCQDYGRTKPEQHTSVAARARNGAEVAFFPAIAFSTSAIALFVLSSESGVTLMGS